MLCSATAIMGIGTNLCENRIFCINLQTASDISAYYNSVYIITVRGITWQNIFFLYC